MTEQTDLYRSFGLKRANLDQQIAEKLEELIISRQLRAGDQLPPERELAKTLGVHRSTLRAATQVLQQRGLVNMQVGRGTYVIEMPSHMVGQAIERYFVSRNGSQKDLHVVRAALEPEMAALAAANAEPEDLDRLDKSLQRMDSDRRSGDINSFTTADADFHFNMAVASHNMLCIAIVSGLSSVMKRWLYTTHRLQPTLDNLDQSYREHSSIYRAIVDKDSERAKEAVRIHLENARIALVLLREEETG